MKIQPELKTHETDLKQLRAERHSENSRLASLKMRLEAALSRPQAALFDVPADDCENAA